MAETRNRRLPVGIQSFEEIREGGYLYVDKTDIVWQLANRGKKYNYLSRPRRFGKSVLVDTLEAYFLGKRELFEGLRIMELEREWVKRPVIRLDMSQAGAEPESVRSYLDNAFHNLETEYGIVVRQESSLAVRFMNIIEGAYNKTGQQVAILIDEYDSPLQHSWRTPHHEACTSIYREVFAILKADDKYEKFVFITGITKFTQISLFSLAGIPPFAGFFSKFFIFAAAFKEGFHLLVFIALLNTVISLYYYLLVVKAMFITPGEHPIPTFRSDRGTRLSLALCTAGVLLLGIASVVYDSIGAFAFGM